MFYFLDGLWFNGTCSSFISVGDFDESLLYFLGESQESKGLFQFMKKTKTVRHKPEGEGIYLDDLNLEEMDPEVAKLYFPKR